jgi:hypothetical protein
MKQKLSNKELLKVMIKSVTVSCLISFLLLLYAIPLILTKPDLFRIIIGYCYGVIGGLFIYYLAWDYFKNKLINKLK